MTMSERTTIYRLRNVDSPQRAEEAVGYIDEAGIIYRLRMGEGIEVGRADSELRIFRKTQHGEREIGKALETGTVQSAGLFEGGDAGWMDPDGVVVMAGMIMGETEIGRVEGPQALAAAAALLLLFLPDEAEADRRASR